MWDQVVNYSFPKTDTDYDNSLWAHWVSRIQQGHNAEEAHLSELEKSGYENYQGYDEYWQISHLSNYMFAALIVAIWSEMEWLLKCITNISKKELKSQNKKQKKVDFKKIITFFKEKLSIDFEKLSSYKTINAIRLLNDFFKHYNGFYRPNPHKPYDQIDPSLLQEWGIVEYNNESEDESEISFSKNDIEIDFSKVPIKNLILACANFCEELKIKVQQELDNGKSVDTI